MESDSFNDFVICPYDKSHKLLRGRLTKHLLRCGRSSGNSNRFIICPFNENHRYDKKEFAEHQKVCPDRLRFEREWNKPCSVNEPAKKDVVDGEDDWDQEPDAPTYNPTAYCMENLVIRSTAANGQSKSERRNLRNLERRRFADSQ